MNSQDSTQDEVVSSPSDAQQAQALVADLQNRIDLLNDIQQEYLKVLQELKKTITSLQKDKWKTEDDIRRVEIEERLKNMSLDDDV